MPGLQENLQQRAGERVVLGIANACDGRGRGAPPCLQAARSGLATFSGVLNSESTGNGRLGVKTGVGVVVSLTLLPGASTGLSPRCV
jgi:hypothetical protein